MDRNREMASGSDPFVNARCVAHQPAFLPLITLVAFTACVSPAVGERIRRMEVFESEPPAEFIEIGEVQASIRFDNLRPQPEQVVQKLKLRAAKKGADAIGRIRIDSNTRSRLTSGPTYVELYGTAATYKKPPADSTPPRENEGP